MALEGPFFAVDGNDVTVFMTAERAAGYLEAADVEAGTYRFYRADGTELQLATEERPAKGLGRLLRLSQPRRVIITEQALGAFPDELAQVLRNHLHAIPATRRKLEDSAIDAAPLPGLVEAACRIERPR